MMKRSLYLIIVFLTICILGTIGAAFIYMLYMNCSILVAGKQLVFFEPSFFLNGLRLMLPVMSVAACLFMIFYLIRHKTNALMSLILFSVISITVWLVLIPASFSFKGLSGKVQIDKERPELTAGFFRPVNKGIYYYSVISDDNLGDGLYIDAENLYGLENGVQNVQGMPVSLISSNGFTDPLIYSSVKFKNSVPLVFEYASSLLDVADKANRCGYTTWLGFASIALSLISLYGLKSCTKWRLINVMIVMGAFVGICYVNILIYKLPFFFKLRLFFSSAAVTSMSSFVNYGGFTGWSGFVPLLVNLLIVVLFTLIGVINLARHNDPNREGVE